MSLSKNKIKKENFEKNTISNKIKKDDMMDFIDKELKIFNKQSNLPKEPNNMVNNNLNVINDKNTNSTLNSNLNIIKTNVNIGLSLQKNLNQPIIPNSQIGIFYFYINFYINI